MNNVTDMHPDRSVVHLAGTVLTADGRLVRQRCAWCGELLTDLDLARTMVHSPDGDTPRSHGFEPGAWIAVDGTNPTSYRVIEQDGERYPERSCMARSVEEAGG